MYCFDMCTKNIYYTSLKGETPNRVKFFIGDKSVSFDEKVEVLEIQRCSNYKIHMFFQNIFSRLN
jgi:hypothetical protein